MMRRGLGLLKRKDVVEVLLRQGRLLDIPVLNFFNSQVAKEMQTLDPPSTVSTTEAEKEPTEADTIREQLRAQKEETFARFQSVIQKVNQSVTTQDPSAWLKEVFTGADTQWSTSYLSALQCRSTTENTNSNTRYVTGTCMAVGAEGTTATSVQLVAQDSTTGKLELLKVPLKAEGVEVQGMDMMLRLKLNKVKAERIEFMKPIELAIQQHVLTSIAYKSILERVQRICALHATHQVQYDSLLVRDKLMQKKLAEFACFSYGLQALADYVVGGVEVEEEEVQEILKSKESVASKKTRIPDVPLLESLMLNVYAERTLMDGLQHAWSIVQGTSLETAVIHRSTAPSESAETDAASTPSAPVMIDYPYLKGLFNAPKYLLTSSDGAMEAQLLSFIGPFLQLRVDPKSAEESNLLRELECEASEGNAAEEKGTHPFEAVLAPLRRVLGLTSGGSVRLTAAHLNLSISSAKVEKDISQFLKVVEERTAKCRQSGKTKKIVEDDLMFVLAVGQYLSEVLATVAVLYRATSVLQMDEARGHREWLLAQSFCAASEERRAKLLFDLSLQNSAESVLKTAKDLDNYSTHPAVLMNCAARSKKESTAKE